MTLFGRLVSDADVETAVLATLNLWLPTYISEVERQAGNLTVGTLARPRSAQSSFDFENWVEGQLPALVVVCPGTAGSFDRQGAGVYSAWFEVQTGVLVEDTTEANARRVAQLHQAAVDGVMVQHGTLGGFATDMNLISRQTRLPDVSNRTLAYAESMYHVMVDDIVARPGGPPRPDVPLPDPTAPWPDDPTITTPATVTFTGLRLPQQ